jgi:hypothetical protein
MRGWRHILRGAASAAALLAASAWAQNQGVSLELAVKATYFYKFVPFVAWPSSVFPSPSSPIALCILGDRIFGDLLDRAVNGQQVDGRPIEIRLFPTVTDNPGCQIAYVSGSAAQSAAEILALLRGTSVLTVTSSAPDGRASGIINFVIEDNRVRFEIDTKSAAANGLVISSKLLSLAVRVK